jgi:hypothetical protein
MRSRLATMWARLDWVPGPVWAGLVLACLELVAFWRPLTGGGVLSTATATFGFVPFRASAPADLGSFYNPLLGDNAREYVPWLMFARDSLRSGVLPQWNPYALAGTPFLANQSSKLYQPVDANYLKVIRPRTFAVLRAYYGASRQAIANLYSRYGADYLVVQRSLLTARAPLPAYTNMAPFGKLINSLLNKSSTRAALSLPATCAVWKRGEITVYELRCVSRSG